MKKGITTRILVTVISGALASTLLGVAGHADSGDAITIDAAVAHATVDKTQAVNTPSVAVPHDPHQPLVLPSSTGTVALGLPTTPTAGKAVHTSAGTTVYPDKQSEADVAVQTTADGSVRVLTVIHSATAPHEYRFPVTVPEGGRLVTAAEVFGDTETDSGEVFVLDAAGRPIGGFAAPWATDANKNPVPTRYRIENNTTLVQWVGFTADTAFPVVADSDWWKVAGCAAAISFALGSTVFVGAKLLRIRQYIAALGGVREAARLIVGATTAEERMRVGGEALKSLAAELTGVAAIGAACS